MNCLLAGSWCWYEHWMDFFAEKEYDSYAIDLRGTSGSPSPSGASKVTVSEHVSDLRAFLHEVVEDTAQTEGAKNKSRSPGPVLLGHSFGGLYVMKVLESMEDVSSLSGVGMMCSVPPSGNGPVTLRYLFRTPILAWNIFRGFVFKTALSEKDNARSLFFDDDLPDPSLEKFMGRFKKDGQTTLDVRDLSGRLPSKESEVDKEGNRVAKFLRLSNGAASLPRLVIGAGSDAIVDEQGVRETAEFLKVSPVILPSMYHDIMLGSRWKEAAELVSSWLNAKVKPHVDMKLKIAAMNSA